MKTSSFFGLTLIAAILCACTAVEHPSFEKLVPVNGTELYVKASGQGEPLVVLHGGPGLSHDYFLPHLEPLAGEFRLILFDQRGMGRSSVDLDSTNFSLVLLVEDIDELRRELGYEQIHLMGHSWGGMLAMRYAIQYPEHLKSLIFCNSVPASSEFTGLIGENYAEMMKRQDTIHTAPLRLQIEEGSRNIDLHERYRQLGFRPSFYDTSDVNRLDLNLSENYFKTQELLGLLPPFTEPVDLFPALENIPVRSLIIRSEMEVLPEEADRKLQQTLPNAQLVSIDRAGHFPFIEQPEEFVKLVVGFLKNSR